jgi:hypothetical protein
MNGVNGMKDHQKIEENTLETKIFIQCNIFWKSTNKNICKKVNTHIHLYLNCLKTFLEASYQTIMKQE